MAIAEIDYDGFAQAFESIAANVERVIEGKADVIRLALIALAAEGHLLVEDVPGVGKTMLAKAIARSISCEWRRIQFTPDLLPSDVTGVGIYDGEVKRFVFKPGPVFANIVLGDEINRASPKTQSALLESMEERQVSVDGVTHPLPRPFMVMATQNPIDHVGTYPLPEAQLDRFIMRLSMGYPDANASLRILDRHGATEPVYSLDPVVDQDGVLRLIQGARNVHAAEALKRYVVDLTEATRAHPGVSLGASPRASLFLLKAARAKAASEGRDYVLPDDVKALARPVLAHRLLLSPQAQSRGRTQEDLVAEMLGTVPVPSPGRR
ncbi:MAG TPA: MoxR family ATPase [Actinomycetota bacterium]|nr:MoxR family ATPase [Actinomycetota bacterium]